jgi:hypothetical protein
MREPAPLLRSTYRLAMTSIHFIGDLFIAVQSRHAGNAVVLLPRRWPVQGSAICPGRWAPAFSSLSPHRFAVNGSTIQIGRNACEAALHNRGSMAMMNQLGSIFNLISGQRAIGR